MENLFCSSGSAKWKEATAGAMLAAADLRPVMDNVKIFSVRKGSTHMAASSCIPFSSQESLKNAKNPMMEMRSLWLKKCALNQDLQLFIFLDKKLNAVSLLPVERPAGR